MTIYQTTTDRPTAVYFAVIGTYAPDGEFVYHYSRPYTKAKTARMRLTTLIRANEGLAVEGAWVVEHDLGTGKATEW